MSGMSDAINFIPPHASGSATDKQSPANTSVTVATTAATQVHPTGIPSPNVFVTWMTTQPVRIRVGDSTVAAATANDMLLPANTYVSWSHRSNETHFTAIRDAAATADALLQRWISSP